MDWIITYVTTRRAYASNFGIVLCARLDQTTASHSELAWQEALAQLKGAVVRLGIEGRQRGFKLALAVFELCLELRSA